MIYQPEDENIKETPDEEDLKDAESVGKGAEAEAEEITPSKEDTPAE